MTVAKPYRAAPETIRSIRQPGPPVPERIQWVEVRGRAFSFALESGLPLLEAARRGFAEAGFAGGVLSMYGRQRRRYTLRYSPYELQIGTDQLSAGRLDAQSQGRRSVLMEPAS